MDDVGTPTGSDRVACRGPVRCGAAPPYLTGGDGGAAEEIHVPSLLRRRQFVQALVKSGAGRVAPGTRLTLNWRVFPARGSAAQENRGIPTTITVR